MESTGLHSVVLLNATELQSVFQHFVLAFCLATLLFLCCIKYKPPKPRVCYLQVNSLISLKAKRKAKGMFMLLNISLTRFSSTLQGAFTFCCAVIVQNK